MKRAMHRHHHQDEKLEKEKSARPSSAYRSRNHSDLRRDLPGTEDASIADLALELALHVASRAGQRDVNTARGGGALRDAIGEAADVDHLEVAAGTVDTAFEGERGARCRVDVGVAVVLWAESRGDGCGGGRRGAGG